MKQPGRVRACRRPALRVGFLGGSGVWTAGRQRGRWSGGSQECRRPLRGRVPWGVSASCRRGLGGAPGAGPRRGGAEGGAGLGGRAGGAGPREGGAWADGPAGRGGAERGAGAGQALGAWPVREGAGPGRGGGGAEGRPSRHSAGAAERAHSHVSHDAGRSAAAAVGCSPASSSGQKLRGALLARTDGSASGKPPGSVCDAFPDPATNSAISSFSDWALVKVLPRQTPLDPRSRGLYQVFLTPLHLCEAPRP